MTETQNGRRHKTAYILVNLLLMFAMVSDSRINSWLSWFIFNLRKINTKQYYESDSLNAGIVRDYMKIQDDKCTIITVHT
jgi:hypothetical protein